MSAECRRHHYSYRFLPAAVDWPPGCAAFGSHVWRLGGRHGHCFWRHVCRCWCWCQSSTARSACSFYSKSINLKLTFVSMTLSCNFLVVWFCFVFFWWCNFCVSSNFDVHLSILNCTVTLQIFSLGLVLSVSMNMQCLCWFMQDLLLQVGLVNW